MQVSIRERTRAMHVTCRCSSAQCEHDLSDGNSIIVTYMVYYIAVPRPHSKTKTCMKGEGSGD